MKVPQDSIGASKLPHSEGEAGPLWTQWGSSASSIGSWGTFMQRGRSW